MVVEGHPWSRPTPDHGLVAVLNVILRSIVLVYDEQLEKLVEEDTSAIAWTISAQIGLAQQAPYLDPICEKTGDLCSSSG